jgi:hypothetical protein
MSNTRIHITSKLFSLLIVCFTLVYKAQAQTPVKKPIPFVSYTTLSAAWNEGNSTTNCHTKYLVAEYMHKNDSFYCLWLDANSFIKHFGEPNYKTNYELIYYFWVGCDLKHGY